MHAGLLRLVSYSFLYILLLCPGASTEAKGPVSGPSLSQPHVPVIANVEMSTPCQILLGVSGDTDTLYTDLDLVLPGPSPACGRCAQCWEGRPAGLRELVTRGEWPQRASRGARD